MGSARRADRGRSEPTEGGSTQQSPRETSTLCSVSPMACAGNQAGRDRERWSKLHILGATDFDAGDPDTSRMLTKRSAQGMILFSHVFYCAIGVGWSACLRRNRKKRNAP